jgi:hypothetical protein
LTSFFPIQIPCISFSCLIALEGNSSSLLNKIGKSRHPFLISDFKRNGFSFSPFSMTFILGLPYIALIMLRNIPSNYSFLRAFTMKGCWILLQAFSASIHMMMLLFSLFCLCVVLHLLICLCCTTLASLEWNLQNTVLQPGWGNKDLSRQGQAKTFQVHEFCNYKAYSKEWFTWKNTRGRKGIKLKKGTDEHRKARNRWKEIIKIMV